MNKKNINKTKYRKFLKGETEILMSLFVFGFYSFPQNLTAMSFEESVIQSGERGWWPIGAGRLKRIEEVKLLIGQKGQNVLSAEKNFYKSFFSEWSKDHYKLEETDIGDGSTMMDLSQMSDEFMTPEMR